MINMHFHKLSRENASSIKMIIFSICVFLFISVCPTSGSAQEKSYKVEVLQVTNLDSFQMAYDGFIKELEREGLVQGKNLTIKRTIMEFDIENASMWKKLKLLLRFKSEASRIVKEKPDLVLTMGTPITKYTKDKIVSAGIPLVFTALAFPTAAGCKSLTEAGPGFTGATSYLNMPEALKIMRKVFPSIKTVGIIHSDDANSIAHVREAIKEGPADGFVFISKQISIKDSLNHAFEELRKQGAEAFVVPPDPYFEIRNFGAAYELSDCSKATRVPIISFVIIKFPGAALYVGPDFEIIGELSGQQAVKILKDGMKPEGLPILRQQNLSIHVDTKAMKTLGIQIPPEILQVAKPVE
jgi:putative tryptophan/tyrosine transport system substrate-binding protein